MLPLALLRHTSRRMRTTTLSNPPHHSSSSSFLLLLRQASSTTNNTSTQPHPHTHHAPPPPLFDWQALRAEKKVWGAPEEKEIKLIQDLRSNHAGETGAVYIYHGAQAAMRLRPALFSQEARSFAQQHGQTELAHLELYNELLSREMKSLLLPLWRVSGWGLGFFPAVLFGEPALYVTVEAVETFVEKHYLEQILPLEARLRAMGVDDNRSYPELVKLLKHCCDEEVYHKNDAKARWVKAAGVEGGEMGEEKEPSVYARAWSWVVEKGSEGAVAVCKRI